MSEHTKGKIDYQDSSDRIIIVGRKNRDYICTVQIKQTCGGAIAESMEGKRKANAAHIKCCWNSHDDLLAACEMVMEIKPQEKMNNNTLAYVEQAIAAAKE